VTATADATTDLIRALDDPNQFERKDRVAIFRPHEREFPEVKDPSGKVIRKSQTVKVTEEDLQEIAKNTNRLYEKDGQLVKLPIGHRVSHPGFPEQNQPKIAGYARNYRAEMVHRPGGPVLRLTHTEYIQKNQPYSQDVLNGQYPERSPEYDPERKIVTAVALLTRDQALPLGTVCYEAGNLYYAMGPDMNDENGTLHNDDWTPDDDKQYATFCKYMKKYGAGMSAMGPMNSMLPGSDQKTYSSTSSTLNYEASPLYSKHTARIAELEAQHAQLMQATKKAECSAALTPLRDVVTFHYERELNYLMNLPTPESRAEHLQYMQDTYKPVGSQQIRIADTVHYAKAPQPESPFVATPQVARALAIQQADLTGKLTWEDCLARAAA